MPDRNGCSLFVVHTPKNQDEKAEIRCRGIGTRRNEMVDRTNKDKQEDTVFSTLIY
jgi:hypothetical protein